MKIPFQYFTAFVATLIVPATADTIYSNLQDTVIPTDFTGVFIDVDGNSNWDINPFFGGVGVANSSAFQPVRTSAGNLGTLQNFAVGSSINVSGIFATGSGGSQDHLGSTFTSGQEGYLGFKLNGNYGWMRVVFTGNTAGAVIKDWAYDNSGAAISTGRVQQSAVSAGTQQVTLSPGSGESFTLGSSITNTGGNINSVLKTGAGTTTFSGSNTYSGITTISTGGLRVNGTNSGTGAVNVASGATLGGSGSVAGTVNITGVLAPGNSIESLGSGALNFVTASTYAYELDSDSLNGDLAYSSGTLSIASGTFLTLTQLASGILPAGSKLTLISSAGAWDGGLFSYNGNTLADDSTIVLGGNEWLFNYNDSSGGSNFSGDQIGATNFVTMTVVPEPNAAMLVGGLGMLALLRRRRNAI